MQTGKQWKIKKNKEKNVSFHSYITPNTHITKDLYLDVVFFFLVRAKTWKRIKEAQIRHVWGSRSNNKLEKDSIKKILFVTWVIVANWEKIALDIQSIATYGFVWCFQYFREERDKRAKSKCGLWMCVRNCRVMDFGKWSKMAKSMEKVFYFPFLQQIQLISIHTKSNDLNDS